MKTKDLVYIGIIGYLAYLLLKKKPNLKVSGSTNTNTNTPPVGNATNGGLNLGSNMDLPNLTPTAPDGLPTEVALSSSNVSPLIKDDNEPTQIFGGVTLPTPYSGTSVVNPNPVDVISASESTPVIAPEPITPVLAPTPIINPETLPTPISTGASLVAEPVFPIKTITAQLITNEPNLGEPIKLSDDIKDEMILECGKSFSIPNNDREGSYTNYWVDGDTFYTQTTSPLIKTIPTKISKEAFIEGCKKFQLVKMQNGKY